MMVLIRFCLARLFFPLIAMCIFAQPAIAKEYILAKKIYLYQNNSYQPKSSQLESKISATVCSMADSTGCAVAFTNEGWSSGDNQFLWSGVVQYTRTYNRGTPQEVSTGVTTGTGGTVAYYCPATGGWSKYAPYNGTALCVRENNLDTDCDVCKKSTPNGAAPPIVGNPIFPQTLMKREVERDYSNAKGTLTFIRTYRSDAGRWSHNYQSAVLDLTQLPEQNKESPNGACVYNSYSFPESEHYCHPYAAISSTNDVSIRRGGNLARYFSSGSNLKGEVDNNDKLSRLSDSNGLTVGWSVRNGETEATEIYGVDGRMQSSQSRQGLITRYSYSDGSTPNNVAPRPGLLVAVTDHYGSALSFTYDHLGNLSTMTTPAGEIFSYAYDFPGNLISVTYPDGRKRSYLYNEPANIAASMPMALTGIIDENESRYATFKYDGAFRAISTEHAGGVEKFTLDLGSSQTTVKDPRGTIIYYNFFDTVLGKKRFTGITKPAPSGTGTISSRIFYDANANVSSMTDFNGVNTTFVFDLSRNLEKSRVEAAGTSLARTTTTEWHANWNLPTRIAEPKRLTSFSYDEYGNLLTKSIQATADANGAAGFSAVLTGSARVWSYTYNQFGQMLTAKGPRTDVDDLTSYVYDEHGNLTSVTNAAGHATTFSNYDPNGHAGTITDPNGLVINLAYTPRGWLASRTVGEQTTSYAYDGVGQLTQVTLPDNSTISYTYDPAHRLTKVVDSLGNSITYTLDAIGNRTTELVTDPSGTLARKTTRIYDALNTLKSQTGGAQ